MERHTIKEISAGQIVAPVVFVTPLDGFADQLMQQDALQLHQQLAQSPEEFPTMWETPSNSTHAKFALANAIQHLKQLLQAVDSTAKQSQVVSHQHNQLPPQHQQLLDKAPLNNIVMTKTETDICQVLLLHLLMDVVLANVSTAMQLSQILQTLHVGNVPQLPQLMHHVAI